MISKKTLISTVAAVIFGALSPTIAATTPKATTPNTGTVIFHAYDAQGKALTWAQFRALQENGNGSNGDNDAMLDPTTLQAFSIGPLFSSGGNPALTLAGKPASLSLAWPTSDGYSNLIIDLPTAAGTYNFNYLAATQIVNDLTIAGTTRPWYVASTAQKTAATNARSLLAQATAATTDSQKGALSAQALDQAVHAETLLLKEAGKQNTAVTSVAQWGVTIDDISLGLPMLQTVQQLYGTSGWVRIVFDKSEPASYYVTEINNAHKSGLKVLGEILDSEDMKSMSLDNFKLRVQSYVATLPTVDEWEVGNEVSGNWLGTTASVVSKVQYAAQYVKQHTSARTLVTLFWTLGEDTVNTSMFTWVKTNMPTILPYTDDVGISLYPGWSSMGSAFDRVMRTLHAAVPNQKLMVTELGFGTVGDDDEGAIWWWGAPNDRSPTGTAATAVASYYQPAVMSFPYSNGGAYWWYYNELVNPANPSASPIWTTLKAAKP